MPSTGPYFPLPATLIANPVSGPGWRRRRIPELAQRAARAVSNLTVCLTESPGHAQRLALQAVQSGVGTVLVAGGDGTVNEVLQAVAGTDTCLGPLPTGTANVLCRELGLPSDPFRALERILSAPPVSVSLGRAHTAAGERYFSLMAGVGLDSAVIEAIPLPVKKHLGVAAYFLQAGVTGLRYRYPRLSATVDGTRHCGTSLIIANARNYAGNLQLAPEAALTRPDLCMVLFNGASPAAYLRFALGVLTGAHLRQRGVTVLHGKRFEIAAETPLPVHVDGEIIGRLPTTVTAMPGMLRLLGMGQGHSPDRV